MAERSRVGSRSPAPDSGRGAASGTQTTAVQQRQLAASASALSKSLRGAKGTPGLLTARQLGMEDLPLPREVLAAASDALRRQSKGEQVVIQVLGEQLKPQEAADLLGVSRPHLNMLLDRERIPYTKTSGGHRRVPRQALEDYRHGQAEARQLMGRAAAAEQDLVDGDD